MKVRIKDFSVSMEIGSKGVELEIRNPQGDFVGDLIITMTKLVWCGGKTRRAQGNEVTWGKFIEWMNSQG